MKKYKELEDRIAALEKKRERDKRIAERLRTRPARDDLFEPLDWL